VHCDIDDAFEQLSKIHSDIHETIVNAKTLVASIPEAQQISIQNLLSYLALRRRDLRPLQECLSALGLSSLGRAEGHVANTLDALRRALRALKKDKATALHDSTREKTEILLKHTDALFGKEPKARRTRIMVTVSTEAADDYKLVRALVAAGMDCMRINCAHDDAKIWKHMVLNLRRANRELRRHCQIAMDLGGPKLRTGPISPAPGVVKARPDRDAYGRVLKPARIWIGPAGPGSAGSPRVPLPQAYIKRLKNGDTLHFTDARRSRRVITIISTEDGGAWAECSKTCYFVRGTQLKRAGGKNKNHIVRVGPLPPREIKIKLSRGDTLFITRDLKPGEPAIQGKKRGIPSKAAHIGCTLPQVFEDARRDEAIWLDDGKIGGIIESVRRDRIAVKITSARTGGQALGSDKGINLPDTKLQLSAITARDLTDLKFVVKHANIVELSFANGAQDVERLQRELKRLKAQHIGIILKIETRRGFEALPAMLCSLLKSPRHGVMIARGDLAVECGFERVAELQEEILWVSEAAHVPVVWATQVLETLTKSGSLSRAEITDAAMGERAECVMLNKGPHVVEAVRVLDDIFQRMEPHSSKKRSMLRELTLASRFVEQLRSAAKSTAVS
jgi:pyruvate kinase